MDPEKERRMKTVACSVCRQLHKKCENRYPDPCVRCARLERNCSYLEPKRRGPRPKSRRRTSATSTRARRRSNRPQNIRKRTRSTQDRSAPSSTLLVNAIVGDQASDEASTSPDQMNAPSVQAAIPPLFNPIFHPAHPPAPRVPVPYSGVPPSNTSPRVAFVAPLDPSADEKLPPGVSTYALDGILGSLQGSQLSSTLPKASIVSNPPIPFSQVHILPPPPPPPKSVPLRSRSEEDFLGGILDLGSDDDENDDDGEGAEEIGFGSFTEALFSHKFGHGSAPGDIDDGTGLLSMIQLAPPPPPPMMPPLDETTPVSITSASTSTPPGTASGLVSQLLGSDPVSFSAASTDPASLSAFPFSTLPPPPPPPPPPSEDEEGSKSETMERLLHQLILSGGSVSSSSSSSSSTLLQPLYPSRTINRQSLQQFIYLINGAEWSVNDLEPWTEAHLEARLHAAIWPIETNPEVLCPLPLVRMSPSVNMNQWDLYRTAVASFYTSMPHNIYLLDLPYIMSQMDFCQNAERNRMPMSSAVRKKFALVNAVIGLSLATTHGIYRPVSDRHIFIAEKWLNVTNEMLKARTDVAFVTLGQLIRTDEQFMHRRLFNLLRAQSLPPEPQGHSVHQAPPLTPTSIQAQIDQGLPEEVKDEVYAFLVLSAYHAIRQGGALALSHALAALSCFPFGQFDYTRHFTNTVLICSIYMMDEVMLGVWSDCRAQRDPSAMHALGLTSDQLMILICHVNKVAYELEPICSTNQELMAAYMGPIMSTLLSTALTHLRLHFIIVSVMGEKEGLTNFGFLTVARDLMQALAPRDQPYFQFVHTALRAQLLYYLKYSGDVKKKIKSSLISRFVHSAILKLNNVSRFWCGTCLHNVSFLFLGCYLATHSPGNCLKMLCRLRGDAFYSVPLMWHYTIISDYCRHRKQVVACDNFDVVGDLSYRSFVREYASRFPVESETEPPPHFAEMRTRLRILFAIDQQLPKKKQAMIADKFVQGVVQ